MVFLAQGSYWVKADNAPVKIQNVSCFDDCIQFLIAFFFTFNVSYAAELRIVFGLLERVMNIPPTMRRSAAVDDFWQQLRD